MLGVVKLDVSDVVACAPRVCGFDRDLNLTPRVVEGDLVGFARENRGFWNEVEDQVAAPLPGQFIGSWSDDLAV